MLPMSGVVDELRSLIRAVGGGLLIGAPLLFTQEVWAHAVTVPAWKIVLLLGTAFVIVGGYNALTGFRADATIRDVLVDSVESMGIGIVVALGALFMIGRLDAASSLREVVGMVALEAIPIAFGAAVARAQLSGGAEAEDTGGGSEAGPIGPFGRIFVTAGGALLFAMNVAPTEEPADIGAQAGPQLLLAMVAFSLLVTLGLVFFAEFGGRRHGGERLLERPWTETVVAYAVSLAVAFMLLWSFGRIDGASLQATIGMTIALGIVASLGGAIGRLLVAPGQPREQPG